MLPLIAAAVILFALCATGRYSVQIGFIERPLVLGLIWGGCTGDLTTPVLLGLCCELFWLDLFPIGSYLPPMPAFSLLLLLPLVQHFGWNTPQMLTLPLFLLLPLAYLPTLLEKRLRLLAVTEHIRLVEASERQESLGSLPGRAVGKNLLWTGLSMAVLYMLCLAAAFSFFTVAGRSLVQAGEGINLGWGQLLGICALGAFLGLRLPRAYLAFFTCICILATLVVAFVA